MKSLFLILVTFTSISAYCQNSDTIQLDRPARPFNMIEALKHDKKIIKERYLPTQTISTYTTVDNGDYLNHLRQPGKLNATESIIVVINNKIYSTEDKAYKQLDPSSIISMNVVKDENSKTNIKSIIFITTK